MLPAVQQIDHRRHEAAPSRADVYPFDSGFLSAIATPIADAVRCINRVVYDYTSKPPGTIEWE